MSSYSENSNQVCQMTQNIELLQGINFFSNIPAQALKIIALLSKRNTIDSGDKLFSEGDDPASCICVISGGFAFTSKHDTEQKGRSCKTGDVVATMSLITPTPSIFSMTATEESEILTIERKTFNKIVSEFPEVYKIAVTNILKDVQRWDAQQVKASEVRCGVSMI